MALSDSIAEGVATLQALSVLDAEMARAAEIITKCMVEGHKLMVCGNGGSAADAADFATEFTCRFSQDRRPFPAINLAGDGSLLTAIGNDYDFSAVFSRQITAYAREGDVAVVFTTSGRSKNIVKALEEATRIGIRSIAFLGRDGGAAAGLATVDLLVDCHTTARVQEAHKFLLHVLCEMVDPALVAVSPCVTTPLR